MKKGKNENMRANVRANVREKYKSDMPASGNSLPGLCGAGESCPEELDLKEVRSELFGLDELSSPVEACLEEPVLKEVCPERKCLGECCLEWMEPVEIKSIREKYWLSPDQIERILGLPAGRWKKLEKGEEFPSPLENRMIRAVSWDEFMLEILEICRPIFSPHEFHTLQDLINAHPSFE